MAWIDEFPLTEKEAEDLGRHTVRVAVALTVAAVVLLLVALAVGLSATDADALSPRLGMVA